MIIEFLALLTETIKYSVHFKISLEYIKNSKCAVFKWYETGNFQTFTERIRHEEDFSLMAC